MIECPQCHTRNKVPDPPKPNTTYRCAKCKTILITAPIIIDSTAIECPQCHVSNKVPDHPKPNITYRCAKCRAVLITVPTISDLAMAKWDTDTFEKKPAHRRDQTQESHLEGIHSRKISDDEVPGFLSKEHKSKFKRIVISLGIISAICQFVVPFILMIWMIFGPILSGGFTIESSDTSQGTYWNNAIWYMEDSFGLGMKSEDSLRLIKVAPYGTSEIEEVAEFTNEDRWLIPGDDELWIISSSDVSYYSQDNLIMQSEDELQRNISSAFLYNGQPAVVLMEIDGFSLMVFANNQWNQEGLIDLPLIGRFAGIMSELQVLCIDGRLDIFREYDDRIYYTSAYCDTLEQDIAPWQEIVEIDQSMWQKNTQFDFPWQAVQLDGKPTLFFSDMSVLKNMSLFTKTITGLQKNDERWSEFFSYDVNLNDAFGVFPLRETGSFAMLVESIPGIISVLTVDGSEIVNKQSYSTGFLFFGDWIMPLVVTSGILMAIALLFVFVIWRMTPKYRTCIRTVGAVNVPYASIPRRGVAKLIDGVIAYWLIYLAYYIMLTEFDSSQLLGYFQTGPSFMLLAGGFLWLLLCFLLFSYLEGTRGYSPGKWVMKIRVLGTDMQPCGFGRAVVRNVLWIVDSIFNYILAVVLVALSENWQRLGDRAANTTVVDIRNIDTGMFAGSQYQ